MSEQICRHSLCKHPLTNHRTAALVDKTVVYCDFCGNCERKEYNHFLANGWIWGSC